MLKKIIKNIELLIQKVIVSTKRFPETILMALCTAVVLIYRNHLDYSSTDLRENLMRIAMVFAIGIPLTLCMKVFFERKDTLNKAVKIGIYLGVALSLVLYYLFLLKQLNELSVLRYVAYSIALYLIFSWIPYVFKRENYDFYVVTLFNRFVTTYLYSGILFLGLVAIIATVDLLFSVNISGNIYFDIWIIVAGVFAPAFFLADIPESRQELDVKQYAKVLKVLLLYIIMPLIVAYSTILYAYFIKIIITRQWPDGILANLVLWFSIISTIVLFFISPLRNSSKWVEKFMAIFPIALIPLLTMMFISIGIRVSAYGITVNRYLVLAAALWVTGCMIYSIWDKGRRNIVFTISLVFISIVSVTGPFSSFSISKWSQNNRLEKILNATHMISADDTIIPSPDIPKVDKEEISSILRYFNNKAWLEDLKYVPDNFEINQTKSVFGFELEGNYWNGYDNKYFNYTLLRDGKVLDIRGFDYFADFTSYSSTKIEDTNNEMIIYYSDQGRTVTIKKNNETIYSGNVDDIVINLHKKISEANQDKQEVSLQEMTYEEKTQSLEIVYVFNHISGSESIDGEVTVYTPMFYILIKMQ